MDNNTITYTNFITPPDVIDPKENPAAVTIIDADWTDVEALALWSQTSKIPFDIYLYHHKNDDLVWLDRVVGLSDYVLINTNYNDFSPYKDKLTDLPKACHYGGKVFLGNTRHVKNPIDFFEQISERIQAQDCQKV
ncbi:MAG: hypothetical protein N2235_11670 [Fischerella sp.]|nr:hypothetical protein [Fischerella sp.]